MKQKGIRAERDLIKMFWAIGCAALRVAGSGAMQFPSPDLLVGNKTRVLAIECKVSKNTTKYIEKEQIHNLKNFSEYFGAEPWVAIKFIREGWFFMSLDDLNESEKNYSVNLDKAKRIGLKIEELMEVTISSS